MGYGVMIYGAVAVLSVLLPLAYLLWEQNRNRLFLGLFFAVALVNVGYFLLAASASLPMAMVSNAISYLGAAFSMLLMLLIILQVCHAEPTLWQKRFLFAVTCAIFCLAASGSWLGLYYRSVSLVTRDGVSRLVKEYGPLHWLYRLYLLGYLTLMVVSLLRALRKGSLASGKYAVFLLAAVLLNLGVWAVEQVVDTGFEFLSVSYVVTEVMLLLIYGLLRDYGIICQGGAMVSAQALRQLCQSPPPRDSLPQGIETLLESFTQKLAALTTAERRILHYYIQGKQIADIPDLAFISIHTVKKHNRSIYQKLEIASRDELMLYIELFRCCGRLPELTGEDLTP